METTPTLLCRLTLPGLTKEYIADILSKKFTKFIVSYEEASNPHFHVLIYHDDQNKKNARQNLRNFLQREFNVEGNKEYSITETKSGTENTLTKYVIKDGNYITSGIDQSILELLKKQSYRKFKAEDFKKSLQKLRDKFIADPEMGIRDHIYDILELKCKEYNQDCNLNLIKNYAISSFIKKSDDNLWTIGNEVYDSIFRHETFIRNIR